MTGAHVALGAALLLGACVPYDPMQDRYARPYAPPMYGAPVYEQASPRPGPPPGPVLMEPLPPPQAALPPLEPEPRVEPLPDTLAPAPPLEEPPRVEPPRAEPSAPAAPSDPVTDLLLTPPSQRPAAAPALAKPGPSQDPFMGFRPMRGQTRPAP